jgi:hypothetical protein
MQSLQQDIIDAYNTRLASCASPTPASKLSVSTSRQRDNKRVTASYEDEEDTVCEDDDAYTHDCGWCSGHAYCDCWELNPRI